MRMKTRLVALILLGTSVAVTAPAVAEAANAPSRHVAAHGLPASTLARVSLVPRTQAVPAALPQPVVLPGCAMTFAPHAGNPAGAICLAKTTGARPAAAPAAANQYVQLWQNGPYPPSSGWGISIVQAGLFYVPTKYNDQASSWAAGNACGSFSVNAPNTNPKAFFSPNTAGNFPRGSVPNDSVSGVAVSFTGC